MAGDNDMYDGCPTLLKMDKSLRTGELMNMTRGIPYKWEDVEDTIRLRCLEKKADSLQNSTGKIVAMLTGGTAPQEPANAPQTAPEAENETPSAPAAQPKTEAVQPAETQEPETEEPAAPSAQEQTIPDPFHALPVAGETDLQPEEPEEEQTEPAEELTEEPTAQEPEAQEPAATPEPTTTTRPQTRTSQRRTT